MTLARRLPFQFTLLASALCIIFGTISASAENPVRIENGTLVAEADQTTGNYTIRLGSSAKASITAGIGAKINGHWISSTDYPKHQAVASSFVDELGSGTQILVTNTGLSGQPDLLCIVRLHKEPAYAEIEVQVRNATEKPITVQAIRMVHSTTPSAVDLDGPETADRVLSDSFSEDRPSMKIHDLNDIAEGVHLAVGSQLIYNRKSHLSLFLAALTSERWLTVLRLAVNPKQPQISGYEVDSTGTTELVKENSLKQSSAEDQVELSLPVAPGASLSSERLLVSIASDYHTQLETYGELIRRLHHARVSAPTPLGWWSWTAYYFGLSEGTALTNAEVLSSHLKNQGYTFFHMDEGYQFARGEYNNPNANHFPRGLAPLEDQVRSLGLVPGIWTSPFQVSERSWVYQNHKDWLVHNAQGQPIHAGFVIENADTKHNLDPLFVLDATNPGAQEYLRSTYTTLIRDWGIRYIKLDFMDDSAIEGYYYRPNTTAMEAQRIGLRVIRETVGDDVMLDKDGSVMLNPVGLVDAGRISCDTGHMFEATKEAAPGLAARYYMNRNFFIADPDAFTVSRQKVGEEDGWHRGKEELTLDEARASIALSAVSGGMLEIGDDLPALFQDAERMALVKNQDLIDMARLGRAAKPIDLMDYAPEDGLPSAFLLHESKRQSVLTVFNWTDKPRSRQFSFADLGLAGLNGRSKVVDILENQIIAAKSNALSLDIQPHSVRMVKIVDSSIAPAAPAITPQVPPHADAGSPVAFSAASDPNGISALAYHWDFGDGSDSTGPSVLHSYTRAGDFRVHLVVEGIENVPFETSFTVKVSGEIEKHFQPDRNRRFTPRP
jgi:alpha-galactosidase